MSAVPTPESPVGDVAAAVPSPAAAVASPVADGAPHPALHLPPFPLPWTAIAGAAALGVLVAATVVGTAVGLQYTVAAMVLTAVGVSAARPRSRPVPRTSWVLAGLAVALAAVPAVSDSTPMVVLSLLTAGGAGILAATESRTWLRILAAPFVLFMGAVLSVPWLGRRLRRPPGGRRLPPGAVRGTLIGVAVLVLIGWLLVGADAAFASLVGLAVPAVDLGELPGRVVAGVVAAWVALAVALVVAAPPWEDQAPGRRGHGPLAEWAVPLVVAALLLAVFVMVQVVEFAQPGALLDGSATPAGRARQGFGQLVTVTVLLVLLLGWAGRRTDPGSARHRTVFAALGGTVVVLVGAVSVTALGRMWAYQEAFGWTVLRILVAAFEIWLALLLVVAALLWLRRRVDLVPPVAAVAAAAGMLLLGLARPEALAAEANVARFDATGRVDVAYLGSLSADAIPAIVTLPRPQRCEALEIMVQRAAGTSAELSVGVLLPSDPWFAANASRTAARQEFAADAC